MHMQHIFKFTDMSNYNIRLTCTSTGADLWTPGQSSWGKEAVLFALHNAFLELSSLNKKKMSLMQFLRNFLLGVKEWHKSAPACQSTWWKLENNVYDCGPWIFITTTGEITETRLNTLASASKENDYRNKKYSHLLRSSFSVYCGMYGLYYRETVRGRRFFGIWKKQKCILLRRFSSALEPRGRYNMLNKRSSQCCLCYRFIKSYNYRLSFTKSLHLRLKLAQSYSPFYENATWQEFQVRSKLIIGHD